MRAIAQVGPNQWLEGGKLCALKLEDTAGVARHSVIAETTSVARIEKSSVSSPPASVPASAAVTTTER